MSRSKKAMLSPEYYDLSEEEMQEVIRRAQNDDGTAQRELIDIFNNFLTKYFNMLYYGKFSTDDYDIRQFVSLFVNDKIVRKYLKRNKLDAHGRRSVNDVMSGIRWMILRYCDEEDVRQTVDMTFLQCVMRYERMKSKAGGYVPFSGYIYSYFYFMLKKNVEAFLIDQLGRKTFPLISDEENHGDDSGESDEPKPGFTGPAEPSAEDLLFDIPVDQDWVSGDTAHPPFDILTVQERQLLKWMFVNGEKAVDISRKITEHPNTVRDHINKIKDKLRNSIEQQEHIMKDI